MFFRQLLYVIALVLTFSFITASASEENRGADKIVLKGGEKGDVSFPHKKHQDTLNDCGKCHTLFPKQPGIIKVMVKQGKLAKKKAMDQCRDCHRETKKAGKVTGPTSCKKCHNKELK